MNNIVIGQYIPGKSWIYRVDPRIKISALVLLLAATFILPMSMFPLMAIMFALMILIFLSTRVPFMKMIRGMRPLLFLLTFTFFLQIFSIKSGALLFEHEMYLGYDSIAAMILVFIFYTWFKKYIKFKMIFFLLMVFVGFSMQAFLKYATFHQYTFQIYQGGLENTGFLIFRVMIVVMLSSLLTFTTMPTDITNGLESLLRPLKVIRFPVSEIAMMLSLTLRFIPTLLEETDKIMKAQASRGVEFSESSFKKKVTQIISLLIPIFVVSFKRAEDLANAMEARGYVVGAKRTRIDVLKMRVIDFFVLFICLGLLTTTILIRTGVLQIAL